MTPESRVENIAAFEREYRTYDFGTRLAELAAFKTHTIVLAIGENVPALATAADQAAFRTAVTAFLEKLMQGGAPTLFVRSTFWADPVKDAMLRQICADAGGTFVDISTLGAVPANSARSERTFTDAGVGSHPGDAGMAAIADAIWNATQRSNTP